MKYGQNMAYIGGIQRFSTEDGPGIRTCVFMKGCPLQCAWCHNPELISSHYELSFRQKFCIQCGGCTRVCPQQAMQLAQTLQIDRQKCIGCGRCAQECCSGALRSEAVYREPAEIIDLVSRDMEFYRNSGGGLTLTGGEILSQAEQAIQIAALAQEAGISVVLETCGYGSREKLFHLAQMSDQILFDLKHMQEQAHIRYTGKGNHIILDNLEALCAEEGMRSKVILRMPLVHQVNDQSEHMIQVRKFMQSHGLATLHLLLYHSMGIAKARALGKSQTAFMPPPQSQIQLIRQIFNKTEIDVLVMGEDNNTGEAVV
ncbi:MAG: glycyl-radical enzyme activating protein [Lachnospiraceae bacterium]